jgi:hypothetical protein
LHSNSISWSESSITLSSPVGSRSMCSASPAIQRAVGCCSASFRSSSSYPSVLEALCDLVGTLADRHFGLLLQNSLIDRSMQLITSFVFVRRALESILRAGLDQEMPVSREFTSNLSL